VTKKLNRVVVTSYSTLCFSESSRGT